MKNINPTQTTAWKKLEKHFNEVQQLQLKELFEKDPERASALGERGSRAVHEKFGIEAMAMRMVEVYQSLQR